MKKKVTKVISILLVISMVGTLCISIVGCGKKEEIVEDTTTTINVTAEELAPEITDEDLGITRKEKKELSKIVGYQSWEGYNFLVLKNEGGDGSVETTIQIEDEDLFNALYNARLYTYVDISYESVSPDDQMYASYAKGLRSLGANFYSMINQKEEEEVTKDQSQEAEETSDEEVEEANEEENESENSVPNEPVEEEDTNEDVEGTDAVDVDETVDDIDLALNNPETEVEEDILDDIGIEAAAEEARSIEKDLQKAIEDYMQSVSLNRATQILVFALDGELLGEMTPAKLNDYVAAFPIEPIPYEPDKENSYISDFEDGVYYEIPGFLTDESGSYLYKIKNDTKKPVTIYIYSENGSKEEHIFENYMSTDKSTGWYLVENEYSFSSTEPTYRIRVEHKNSDTDLASALSAEKVLYIDELESEVVEIPSNYMAIVNNTDQEVYIEADTEDYCILGSKQSIGIHKSAYSSLKYYFEGAGVNPSDEENSTAAVSDSDSATLEESE